MSRQHLVWVLLTLFIIVIGWLNYLALAKLQGNTGSLRGNPDSPGVVLNADRDLYQALIAQQEFLLVQGKGDKAAGFRKDFDENVQQAKERMEKFIQHMTDYRDHHPAGTISWPLCRLAQWRSAGLCTGRARQARRSPCLAR